MLSLLNKHVWLLCLTLLHLQDMGGAALMLALSHVIISAQLPARLRVLLPAVENAVSGSSYRPGDVLQTRAGITVSAGGAMMGFLPSFCEGIDGSKVDV
jgi:hypothetical protein